MTKATASSRTWTILTEATNDVHIGVKSENALGKWSKGQRKVFTNKTRSEIRLTSRSCCPSSSHYTLVNACHTFLACRTLKSAATPALCSAQLSSLPSNRSRQLLQSRVWHIKRPCWLAGRRSVSLLLKPSKYTRLDSSLKCIGDHVEE